MRLLATALFTLLAFSGYSQNLVLKPKEKRVVSNILFLFTGESNSGGQALNSSASAPELAARPEVQILNNTNFDYQDLEIGVNNNIGHEGITNGTTHGWELQLANWMDSAGMTCRLVKAGQGSTRIGHWHPDSTYLGTSPWNRLVQRMDSALEGTNSGIVIFYSQGINDITNGTDEAVWEQRTKDHLNRIRRRYGASIPIIMTKFFTVYTALNDNIDNVCAEIPNCYSVTTTEFTRLDGVHWDYTGMKGLCNKLMQVITDNFIIQ